MTEILSDEKCKLCGGDGRMVQREEPFRLIDCLCPAGKKLLEGFELEQYTIKAFSEPSYTEWRSLNTIQTLQAENNRLREALDWCNTKAKQTGGNGHYGCVSTRMKMLEITEQALSSTPTQSLEVYRAEREVIEATTVIKRVKFDTYKARNGRECGIEDGSGEKCWIVPFEAMHQLDMAVDKLQSIKGDR